MTSNGYEVSLEGDEHVLKLDSGDSCTTSVYTKNPFWYVNDI